MWGIIATWRMAVEGISKASQVLAEGGDAGDAIEIAVREVEDFPYYKSVGYGGLPNEEMEVELDAAFMDGDTLDIGAVAAIKDYANPVSIARRLSKDDCKEVGLNIIDLEDFPSLNDAVLSLHSCYTIMIDKYSYSKIVENQNGETYFYRDPCNN